MYHYAVVLGALCASCSEAWVMVPPRGCDKLGRRGCQEVSPHRNVNGRRGRALPVDDQAEGTTPPPPPLEKSPVSAAEAGGSRATGRRTSWQEQFASLRNDAADPWSARSADNSSRGAPAASLGFSANKDGSGVQEQASTGGGAAAAAVREEVAEVESPLTATTTATAVPEETGTSSLHSYLLSPGMFLRQGAVVALHCCCLLSLDIYPVTEYSRGSPLETPFTKYVRSAVPAATHQT